MSPESAGTAPGGAAWGSYLREPPEGATCRSKTAMTAVS